MGTSAPRPTLFRRLGLLEALNVAAVGCSVAAGTTATFTRVLTPHEASGTVLAIGTSTTIIALVWAALLRSRRTIAGSPIRVGWVASVPLAMANAAASLCLITLAERSHESLLGMAILAATVGSVVWIPALFAVLVCFGLPIAWGQSLAAHGLAGEEKGERIVGLACTVIALASIASSLGVAGAAAHVPVSLGAAGGVLGAFATLLAFGREARRRRFVAQVEGGHVPGYRVDLTDKGRVLFRIASEGHGYRVADVEEELAVIEADDPGAAMKRAVIERST